MCAVKYLRLILRSLFRSKRRTILTVLFLAVSVFLVATLQNIHAPLDGFAKQPHSTNRLRREPKFPPHTLPSCPFTSSGAAAPSRS